MTIYGVMSWNTTVLDKDGMKFFALSWKNGSWIIERDWDLLEVVPHKIPQDQIWLKVGEVKSPWKLPYLQDRSSRYSMDYLEELPLLTFMYKNMPIVDFDKTCVVRDTPSEWRITGLFTFYDYKQESSENDTKGIIENINRTIGIASVLGGFLRDGVGIGLTDSLDEASMTRAYFLARADHQIIRGGDACGGGSNLGQLLHYINEAYQAEREARYTCPPKRDTIYNPERKFKGFFPYYL